ncbi:MAG: TolC family outer membrane protein [Acidisphaera sp.]|nr:TolC family outer membrane protein [Acidisphaera sp.]
MRVSVGVLAGCGALLVAAPALADQPPPRTLAEALGAAYSNNPTLLAERAHLRAVDENVPTALAGWRPTVVLQAAPGYAVGTIQQTGSPSQNNQRDILTLEATLTQPIYRGGKTKAQTSQAENSVMAERARLIANEQQVFSDTINAYVTVIEDQQLLALAVNNVQVLAKQLQATNDRFRVGEITRTDVAQAEAALAGAQAQRDTAEGNLQTARAMFRQQVGVLPDQLLEPQPLALPIRTAQDANQLASVNNPNVVAALFDDAAQKDAIDVQYAALMPTVSVVTTGFQENNTTLVHSRENGGEVTANITVPLFQGGSEYAAVRQARQTEQQSRKTLDAARRAAVQLATSSWETLIAARATVDSTRAQIRANEIALEGVEREALVGSRTTLDVLNAEQALLSSRVTLVQNLAALVNASYQVAAAIGRLTARDLGLRVPLYDETAYYNAVRNRWIGTGDYARGQPGR